MAPALGRSASAPGLDASSSSRSRLSGLRNCTAEGVGAVPYDQAAGVTDLYSKMKRDGKFHEVIPHIKPAGRSVVVPLADSAERDLQPELYFPLPATPCHERPFRKLTMAMCPGDITTHYGLKDQKLEPPSFRYGVPNKWGHTVADTLKDGQVTGCADYCNSVAEMVYESRRREPLGRPMARGHTLKMLPQGYGNPSDISEDGKFLVFPVETKPDSEDIQALYRRTHCNFKPGERINRNYSLPPLARDPGFRYGANYHSTAEGAGAALVLNPELVDNQGTLHNTRVVLRTCEDFRNVERTKVSKSVPVKQSVGRPKVPPDTRFGIKSSASGCTVEACIRGFYSREEQLPDQDIGHCTKPGRRNVTTETRAFGTPSVRSDLEAPLPQKRSIANFVNYGDDCNAAAVLAPERFADIGVSDREFLTRRTKEDVVTLFKELKLPGVDADLLWEKAVSLFDDGHPTASLDSLLYVHSQQINEQVGKQLGSVAMSCGFGALGGA